MAQREIQPPATLRMPSPRRPAVSVSDYRIVRKLGEGGMGEVYEAEQQRPIRRRVALKVIKRGMDSAAVIARFESERQALAVMDHPSIARIFAAGVTERGRPFFAMEFVDGVPVTDYCDDRRLCLRERLELFIRICRGVHHAHQKGIIHRDLKPSNVLVTVRDGRPVPKIIDFGIAKAAAESLTDSLAPVGEERLLGTPEYMSPEQTETEVSDVDTRSDVYCLGVLLYRLLAGVLPFAPEELRRLEFDEARRKICEEVPPAPSERVSALDDELAAGIAGDRRCDPPGLVQRLRGDLDWIVMKALQKDRLRRYDSTAELAADLTRHLEDRPVNAAPPSTVYRLAKLVRRRRLAVAAAAAVAMALLLGIAGVTASLVRTTRAEARAKQEAETARRVAEFLAGLFDASDPFYTGESAEALTARQMLDRGAERLQTELADQPEIRASLLDAVGGVYRNVAAYDRAEALLRQGLEIRERTLPAGDLGIADSLANLGELYRAQGRYQESEPLLQRAAEIRGQRLGDHHPEVAEILHRLATLYKDQGRYERSEQLYRRVLAIRERALGPEHDSVGAALSDLGLLTWKQGRHAEAESLLVRSVAIREQTLGPENPNFAGSLNNLGLIYAVQEKYAEALPVFERSLAILEKTLGPDDPRTATTLGNLAGIYNLLGKAAEAEPLMRRTLEIRERTLGPGHPQVAIALSNLGELYSELERWAEAEALLRRAIAIWEAAEADPAEIAHPLLALADLCRDQSRYREAETLYLRALRVREEALGPEHPLIRPALESYSAMLRAAGRGDEAAALAARLGTPQTASPELQE